MGLIKKGTSGIYKNSTLFPRVESGEQKSNKFIEGLKAIDGVFRTG